MKLVLYLGWPSALALVVVLVGLRMGEDGPPPGRRISTSTLWKYEALSVCVQAVTGERGEAEQARVLVDSALTGIVLPGPRRFTVPAIADTGCPREAARYGVDAKSRRVSNRGDGRSSLPSPYHVHVYLMPNISLQMLRLEPDLGNRHLVVEEYVVEGAEPNVVLAGVTFGLYASIDELADGPALRRFFDRALLMQSQLGVPPHS